MTPVTQLSLIRPEEVAKILGCSVVYIYNRVVKNSYDPRSFSS